MTAALDSRSAARVAAPTWAPAALVAALAVGSTVAALVLDLQNSAQDRADALMGWGVFTCSAGLLALAGAVPILVRYPRHLVAWVMAATGIVWCLDGLAESWSAFGIAREPDLPLTGFAVWFVAQLGAVLLVGLPMVLALYPDGRLLPGRWRRVGQLTVVMAFALPAALAFAPADLLGLPAETGMPELPLSDDVASVVLGVTRVVTLLALPLAVLLVFVRHRRAEGVERTRLRWLVWAAIICVLMAAYGLVAPSGLGTTIVLILCLGVTSGSMAIGILAPDLTDVDALMGGTLVFAAVALSVIGLDLLLVATLSATLGDRLDERQVILLVLLFAVAAYGPLRTWLGAVVRRALVGRRGDRYAVVTDLAARLEASADVRTQLPALATAGAAAVKRDVVRGEVVGHAGGPVSATPRTRPVDTREVPIRYGEEEVGRLELPARGVRSMLSKRDQALLFDVVRQAAMAVRSSRLADDLQHSREQLVVAREDDRRRIRRDLHDGLGPVLGGVAMRLDAAGNAMESDPETARRLVAQSRQDITDALADVRRLVHGLRPPALDDLGLLAALNQQADRMRSADLTVAVEAEDVPALSAAVEVAAYRIASEALTNTARHAGAGCCKVRLLGGPHRLLVEVADDGIGIDPDITAGVGLRSIRERAEELGGRAEITCPASGGTRVRAWLPLSPTTARNEESA